MAVVLDVELRQANSSAVQTQRSARCSKRAARARDRAPYRIRMPASTTVGLTKQVCTLTTRGRTGWTRRLARLVAAGAGDEQRAAVQVGVHLAGGPAQQLADRAVAADDLDGGLDVAVRPLLEPAALVRVDRHHVGDRCGRRAVGELGGACRGLRSSASVPWTDATGTRSSVRWA